MVQRSTPINIPHGKKRAIRAPYHDLGMRLSGHAEWGTTAQWRPQALFEYGNSTYDGKEGTAYDLSVMTGSDKDVEIGECPIRNGRGSSKCPSKTCFLRHCPLGQGWTHPDPITDGSPADTIFYAGKTDFKVVFCP